MHCLPLALQLPNDGFRLVERLIGLDEAEANVIFANRPMRFRVEGGKGDALEFLPMVK